MDGLLNLNPASRSPQPAAQNATVPDTTETEVKQEDPPRLERQRINRTNIPVQVT